MRTIDMPRWKEKTAYAVYANPYLTLAIPEHALHAQHLGAAPTTVNIKEVYSALRTHLADAQENALGHVELFKFYEVQKYCSLTNHFWDGFWIMANKQSMDSLPPDLRAIMMKNFDDGAIQQRADMVVWMDALQAKLSKRGLIFNQPDFGSFREALSKSGFYKIWREKAGEEAWAALEKYTGKIG